MTHISAASIAEPAPDASDWLGMLAKAKHLTIVCGLIEGDQSASSMIADLDLPTRLVSQDLAIWRRRVEEWKRLDSTVRYRLTCAGECAVVDARDTG